MTKKNEITPFWSLYDPWPWTVVTLVDGTRVRGQSVMRRKLPDGTVEHRARTDAEIVDEIDRCAW